jgi:outer membrane lipoprotein SlyB
MLCTAIGLLAMGLAACAAKRPVLYPNAHAQRVGDVHAQQEVDECIELARSDGYGADPAGRAGTRVTGGAAVGAATGAAAGAVLGNAARGAATGAAAGGARSLVRGLFAWREPDPIERGFVQECLRERGYRVIGWD